MAVPKKKTTKSKRNMRRMHIYLKDPSLVNCDKCKEKKLMHTVCSSCGYYKGREVINVLGDDKKEKKVVEEKKPLKMEELSKGK